MTTDTKESLLDAAEALFADRGVAETSLRAITQQAGANLASVNYHFGSKEALVKAVLDRRVVPLNRERLQLLDACEAAAPSGGRPPLEGVVHALVAPAFQLSDERGQRFARCLSRLHFEPDEGIQELIVSSFAEVFDRFTSALRRCLPELAEAELLWRFFFTIGAMAMAVANRAMVDRASGGRCDPSDDQGALEHLVTFLAAGFRAAAGSASPASRREAGGGS